MRDRYGARDERSLRLRFHTQTAGVSLTEQQPENNIVRVALQALAAVLGGTQSLHTNSMDETIALPSEKAVKIALRTQQILAYETGVANVVDPLAGSYYVEALTDRLEREAEDYFTRIEEMGGVVAGIEAGFFQREIARAAYLYQQEVERRERIVVGVNEFVEEDERLEIPILRISPEVERRQRERLAELRATRDQAAVDAALARLRDAVRGTGPVFEPVLDAARAYATLGEIVDVMRAEFGGWREPAGF
jgi:methylmalonyl-CoA mutase N-terminal domain/subunit